MNEEEFEQQFEAATERGRIADLTQPQYQVEKVYYDKDCGFIVIHLKNGAILQIPRQLLQGLKEATSKEIAQMELMPGGRALHWDNLDVHFTIPDF